MSKFRTLTMFCLALTVAGCSEITSPLPNNDAGLEYRRGGSDKKKKQQNESQNEWTSSSWDDGLSSLTDLFPTYVSATIGDGGSATGLNPDDVPDNTLEQAVDAPELTTYSTSFTHKAGKSTVFQLNYDSPGLFPEAFLFLTIPEDAQVLDEFGNVVPNGQEVEITVEVDLQKFLVHFGPHGSTFLGDRPAELWFKYQFADQDGHDVETMKMWYQAKVGDQWSELETAIDTFGYWARAKVYHFSNYAVAW